MSGHRPRDVGGGAAPGGPPASSGDEGPPSSATGAISRKDALWLASMHLWAGCILLCFSVPNQEIAATVLNVFAQAKAEWSRFEAPPELFVRTARRRWLAELLLQRAADCHRVSIHPRPRDVAGLEGTLAPAAPAIPEELVTVHELLRWLEQRTTPERWRMWLAHEVDDVSLAEIARQEGCSTVRVRRLLERARGDLQAAFSRQAASPRGSFVLRPRHSRPA